MEKIADSLTICRRKFFLRGAAAALPPGHCAVNPFRKKNIPRQISLTISMSNIVVLMKLFCVCIARQFHEKQNCFLYFYGIHSSLNNINCGVPQGSVLRPLFFLLYTNDLCNVWNIFDLVLFADDTNIFFSHDLPSLMNVISIELLKLSEWFKVNKLSINIDININIWYIRCYMIFKPRQKRQIFYILLEIINHRIYRVRGSIPWCD